MEGLSTELHMPRSWTVNTLHCCDSQQLPALIIFTVILVAFCVWMYRP